MATIIYAAGQEQSVNLDNVDFLEVDDNEAAVKFLRRGDSNKRILITSWEYSTVQDAQTAYQKILEQFGNEIIP